ncbi:MAG: hypothetical protein V4629_02985 [Pseudomonadota bacterium]
MSMFTGAMPPSITAKTMPSVLSAKTGKDKLQNAQASLSQEQYQDYLTNYVPYENQLINYAMDDSQIGKARDQAGKMSEQANQAAWGTLDRNMGRYKTYLQGDQLKSLQERSQMSGQLNTITNKSNAISDTYNRQQGIKSNLLNYAQDTQNKANDQLSGAASLESGRNQRNDAAKAQSTNTLISGAAGLGALMFLSTKDAKEKIKPHSTKKALSDIKETNLKSYSYKGTKEKTIGTIAEDAPASIKRKGGKAVDVQSWMGNLTGAIQELDKKISQLQGGK